ncbi:peptidase [Paractinoplanes deccanensis]|uniref:Peptidase n=1 Tax=Paractinoplanes deccanensis TaxID=113561 RepID=A0ABQ3YC13_9ACTN|nr:S8 family serine peptidase [Actinoplanes deccanensis]GID77517.1 peptidase [Actinoplanes deccanensis]
MFHSVLAVVTTAALATVPAGQAGPAPVAAPAGEEKTVTLITGDKVTVTGTAVSVAHATGGVRISTYGDDTYAYPDAAMPYVASGLLDEDLFNVTKLIADGYDDAHAGATPLIVEYAGGVAPAGKQPAGVTPVRTLASIGGAALTVDHDAAAGFFGTLARKGTSMKGTISRVWLDGKVRATLADSTAQIGAPQVWAGGDTGAGVDVAVLDTGVDTGHPDLAGRIAETASFVPGEEVTDRHGHGTHVASTIAGTGAASGGTERGVAPGAELHIGKVLDDAGEGQDSWIIGGMEWAARTAKAKVISMSLGGGPSDGTDPLSAAVNRLSDETGALFVIAAGNSGPDAQTVSSPGAADAALTVGAVDAQDRLAVFSSRGPRPGDNAPKPDISGPGVDILAARSQYAPEGEGAYQTMSGTSMATPHVAGAAALLAAEHPDWTGRQLKDALMSTSKATPRYPIEFGGTGRVDVPAAVDGTLFATGTTFASLRYPYEPGQRAEQTITYTNTGDAPVTLDLAATGDAFTLPQKQVTVPAHGAASAKVVVPLDVMKDDTYAIGSVSGTDGITTLRTTVGLNREGERANLTVTAKGPDGRALAGLLILKDVKHDTSPLAYEVNGSVTMRLPTSTWSMWLYADVPGLRGPRSLGRAVLVAPEVVLGADRTLTLDGTKLVPAKATTPERTSVAQLRVDLYRSYPDRHPFGDDYTVGPQYDSVWATPTGKKVTQGSFSFGTRWSAVQPPLAVSVAGRTFDDLLYQSGSPRLPDGVLRRPAVLVKPGGSFAPARGKVAVVRYAGVDTAIAQAAAAAKAGATLLLVVNTGAGRLDAWWEVGDPVTPLPVAGIAPDEGEQLIARLGRGDVTVEAHPAPHYVYDLSRWFQGAVPADLTFQPRQHELARVEQEFRAVKAGSGLMARGDMRPDRPGSYLYGPVLTIPLQGRRTDWVSSGTWVEQAGTEDAFTVSAARSYPAGRTSRATWFAPVGRPRLFAQGTFTPPSRLGDMVAAFGIPAFGDSDPHHQGVLWSGQTQTTSLYQGATKLAENAGDSVDAVVGNDAVALRLVTETANDGTVMPYSTRTRTEWSFVAPATDPAAEPVFEPLDLVQLDYAVATDLAGRAARHGALGVSASRVDGTPLRTAVKVEVSYDDGRTWHTPRGKLDAPRHAKYVSVRATAEDKARRATVTQTVIRAFGLR